ncbi:MAG: hypothetical protein OSA48_03340 [Akkermansiaceae bacterium]|nr:hypothetical protein [Akkermansiaceae bacterium]
MLSEFPTDQLLTLIGAAAIFVLGLFIIIKVTKSLFKLLVAIGVVVVLVILFHDKIPL